MSGSASYQDELIEALKDPAEAAQYLTAALEEGDCDVLVLALQNVVEARIAAGAAVETPSRERLERSLTDAAALCDLKPFLEGFGLKLTVAAK